MRKNQETNSSTVNDILNTYYIFEDYLLNALEKALKYGNVLTLPELLTVPDNHELRNTRDLYLHTEENIGVDTKGLFYEKGEPVLVIVHGGGILAPSRIRQTYSENESKKIAQYAYYYDQGEIDVLLEGKVSSGENIPMFKYEDIKKGISDLPHRFGSVTPFKLVSHLTSGRITEKEFINNPLAISRAGGTKYLKKYFDEVSTKEIPFEEMQGGLSCFLKSLFIPKTLLCEHSFNSINNRRNKRYPVQAHGYFVFAELFDKGMRGMCGFNTESYPYPSLRPDHSFAAYKKNAQNNLS